jgi:cytidyltransferase-like protein
MKTLAIYPGSFNPFHIGHLNIVDKMEKIFGYENIMIAIGTNPVATQDNFHITTYNVDVIKETLRSQRIVGIVTGTTTKLIFDTNEWPSFAKEDYITITGATTAGINTAHNSIVSLDNSSITINYNSSAITSPNVNGAVIYRSVKVSCLTYEPSTFFNISEVVTLVSE